MGRKKLLKRLAEFFDLETRDRAKRREEMSEVLSRLKQKELELKQELDNEKDDKSRKQLQQKIDLVHSPRKKGVSALQDLSDNSKPK